MISTFGAPSGAAAGRYGDQSGTESRISTAILPLRLVAMASLLRSTVRCALFGMREPRLFIVVGAATGRLPPARASRGGVIHPRCSRSVACWFPHPTSAMIEPMADPRSEAQFHRLRTPRSAAIAGIVFGVLFATCVACWPRRCRPPQARLGAGWISDHHRLVPRPDRGHRVPVVHRVLRDRFGDLEDRFFSTVFVGSGLLFLAMTFVSMALAGALLAVSRNANVPENDIVYFGREVMLHVTNVYAVRMAAVFMISLATMWWRTRLMPGPLVIATYLFAVVLLVVVSFSLWVALVFPAWVLAVSVYILATDHRQSVRPREGGG